MSKRSYIEVIQDYFVVAEDNKKSKKESEQKLEAAIETLTKTSVEYTTKLETELNDTREEMKTVKADLEEAVGIIKGLKSNLEDAGATIVNLKNRLKGAIGAARSLGVALASEHVEVVKVEKSVKELKKEREELYFGVISNSEKSFLTIRISPEVEDEVVSRQNVSEHCWLQLTMAQDQTLLCIKVVIPRNYKDIAVTEEDETRTVYIHNKAVLKFRFNENGEFIEWSTVN